MIDRESPVPVYQQISSYLKDKIISGEYQPEDRIPSEPKLAELFSVSRVTARNAVSSLVNENYLYRRHREGTFVSKPRVETNDLTAISLMQNTLKKGFTIHSSVLSICEMTAEKDLQKLLELRYNEKIIILKRLRYINDKVTVLQESFVPRKFCPEFIEIDWSVESLYKVITRDGQHKIGSAKESLEAINGTEEILNCLEITKDTPVLYSERLTKLSDSTPIEFVKSWYRGDRYKFEFELK